MRSNENMEELQKLYDIKALIRTGSFSKFVRVEQKTTKKPFAIKVMETRMREGREACESEFSILRWVSYHYIVQLLEIFETQDQVYMVMELATGGEFFDGLISQGYFTEQDAVRILHMVADGMRYLQRIENNLQGPKARKSLVLSPRCRVKIFYHRFWFGTLWEQKG
nr:serine/threonine-protein kinase H2 isoform X1 [Kogia breviceps]